MTSDEREEECKTEAVNQCSPNPGPITRRRRSERFDSPYDDEEDRWHEYEGNGYVVIAEFKEDEPLVYETYLHYSTWVKALEWMRKLADQPGIIRVAIAKLVFVDGNHALVDNRRKGDA